MISKSKKTQNSDFVFSKCWKKKSIKKLFLLHPCARQGIQTHHNLTYTQNVDKKGAMKFNQIKFK